MPPLAAISAEELAAPGVAERRFDSGAPDVPEGPLLSIFKPATADRRRMRWSLATSILLHASAGGAALYTGVFLAPRVLVSESGRNSVALVSSMRHDAPPSDAELVLPKHTQPQPDTSTRMTSPAEAEKLSQQLILDIPIPMPRISQRKPQPVKAVAAATASAPRAQPDPELRLKKPAASRASVASAGSAPSRGADVDRLPRAVFNPAPEYPPEALQARLAGRAVLRVLVGIDGRVLRAELHRTSGNDVLDAAALRAVRSWRFDPAQRGGKPVEHEIAVPVRFVIDTSQQGGVARSAVN